MSDQKRGYATQKRLLYILFGMLTVCGTVGLAWGVVPRFIARIIGASFTAGEALSIGVIGGADGPTAIYVGPSRWMGSIISAAALAVGIVGILVLSLRKRK